MNINLKLKIMEKYRYQVDFSRALGISEDRLSRIIHGRVSTSQKEKEKIAGVLGVRVQDIFNEI